MELSEAFVNGIAKAADPGKVSDADYAKLLDKVFEVVTADGEQGAKGDESTADDAFKDGGAGLIALVLESARFNLDDSQFALRLEEYGNDGSPRGRPDPQVRRQQAARARRAESNRAPAASRRRSRLERRLSRQEQPPRAHRGARVPGRPQDDFLGGSRLVFLQHGADARPPPQPARRGEVRREQGAGGRFLKSNERPFACSL
ncbi:hypothetical protein MTO96_021574 [Rhipicephalus appendiculatus]